MANRPLTFFYLPHFATHKELKTSRSFQALIASAICTLAIFQTSVSSAQVPAQLPDSNAIRSQIKGLANKIRSAWRHVDLKIDRAVMLDVLAHRFTRSVAETKLESSLLEIKHQLLLDGSIDSNESKPLPPNLQINKTPARVDSLGRINVYVDFSKAVTLVSVVTRIRSLGGEPDATNPRYQTLQAWIDPFKLDSVAMISGVNTIRLLREPTGSYGPTVSEGVGRLRADVSQSLLGTTGSGITVGILSDDFGVAEGLFDSAKAHGELNALASPVIDNWPATRLHEGLAMAEIVQDVAPGAKIRFAPGFFGEIDAVNKIDSLVMPVSAGGSGCTVICDDVFDPRESEFEDGVWAQEINYVTSHNDVVYVSSANNNAHRNFFGRYKDTIKVGGAFDGKHCMNFGGSIFFHVVIKGFSTAAFTLQWDDPLQGSANDYDLFICNSSGIPVSQSGGTQSGTQNPYELATTTNGGPNANYYLVIQRISVSAADPNPTPRIKITSDDQSGFLDVSASGGFGYSIAGHTCADSCLSIGAINAQTINYNTIEDFSDQGPSLLISYPSRTSRSRQKPDLSSFDNVTTAVSGFAPFTGTSAAAPHVAGVAALLRAAVPGLNGAQCRAALRAGCVDEGNPGVDSVFGAGRLDAFQAITLALSGSNNTIASFAAPNAPIPDGTGSATSILNINPGKSKLSPCATNLVDSVYVSVTVDGHQRYGDLIATLTSPDGTSALLLNRAPGGTGSSTGMNPNLIFGDVASTPIEGYDPGSTEVIGFYAPATLISSSSAFQGKQVAGNWTLKVKDTATGFSGVLKEWGLFVKLGSESLSLSADLPYIWSADHALKTVNITPTVKYGCTPNVTLVSIVSNEPDAGTGPGDLPNDIVQISPTQFQLRAECQPKSNGRLYTATYNLTDGGGFNQNFSVVIPVACSLDHLSPVPAQSPPAVTLNPPSANPLITSTQLSYSLPSDGPVYLKIFNLHGKWEKSLDYGDKTAGYHAIFWDGTDAAGHPLPNATYIYQLDALGVFRDGVLTLNR